MWVGHWLKQLLDMNAKTNMPILMPIVNVCSYQKRKKKNNLTNTGLLTTITECVRNKMFDETNFFIETKKNYSENRN